MLHDLTKLKITKDKTLGYEVVYYPKHPFARKGSGVVYLHRIIMENHLGRYLKQDEHVHHKDENRSNNVIENLELITNSEHIKHHNPINPQKIKFCAECKKEFKADKIRNLYCSTECYSKNHKKIEWPSVEYIEEQLKIKSMVQIGKDLGVSDNAVRKYLKKQKQLS